jgi:hypothetical protein
MLSYHGYPHDWGPNIGRDVQVSIDVHELSTGMAGKVAYLGEFGHAPAGSSDHARDDARARALRHLARTPLRRAGEQLGVLWRLIPQARRQAVNDGFGVVYPADAATSTVLTRWTAL